MDGDLDLESRWGANPYPQWLQVDLEDVCELDAIHIYTYWDGWRYYQYVVEVSLDGASWTQVVDMSQNTTSSSSSGFLHRISPITARFLRVTMLYNSANPGVHVVELEVYGTILPPGRIELNPLTPIFFGKQDINAGSTIGHSISIQNTDPVNYLVIKEVALKGPHAVDFALLSDSGEKVLAPLETRIVEVVFNPFLNGTRTAYLEVQSNDPLHPEVKVELIGEGKGRLLNLIPYPREVVAEHRDLLLTKESRIFCSHGSLSSLAGVLADEIFLLTGIQLVYLTGTPGAGDIHLAVDPLLEEEEYTLQVTSKVVIKGKDRCGVTRGMGTLIQLMAKGMSIPLVKIQDGPTCGYRAVSIDVARRHHAPDLLKQLVEICKFYKIHYLGLHLTDDQNFMFPSTAFPDLDNKNFDQPAYTTAQLQELEQYALDRGVQIVPELDVPGHCAKMVQTYPQVFGSLSSNTIDFRLPSCKDAVKTLISEMCGIFQSTPLFHVGGDESGFSHLPEFADFFRELNDHVKSLGKTTLMWEGFSQGTDIPKDICVLNWESSYYPPNLMLDDGYSVINAGWDPLYVCDHYPWIQYTYHTMEHLYEFDRFTFGHVADGYPASNGIVVPPTSDVPGAEICWWEGKGYNAAPFLRNRIPPFSARVWNPEEELCFESFQARVKATEAVMERLLFPVTVSAEGLLNQYWKQAQQFEDAVSITLSSKRKGTIRYTLDNSEPNSSSPAYTDSFKISTDTIMKAALYQGAQRIGFATRIGYQKVSLCPNVTTGKKVTTDATLFMEHPPSLITDGVVEKNTYWTAYRNPKWICIDLGAPVSLDSITVFTRWGGGYYEQYAVSVSLDGQSWRQVADYSQNTVAATAAGYTHGFSRMDVRHIRVDTLGNSWFPSGHFPRIVEVTVHEAK